MRKKRTEEHPHKSQTTLFMMDSLFFGLIQSSPSIHSIPSKVDIFDTKKSNKLPEFSWICRGPKIREKKIDQAIWLFVAVFCQHAQNIRYALFFRQTNIPKVYFEYTYLHRKMHLRRLPSRDGGQKHFLCSPKVVFFFSHWLWKKKKKFKRSQKNKKKRPKGRIQKKKGSKRFPHHHFGKKKNTIKWDKMNNHSKKWKNPHFQNANPVWLQTYYQNNFNTHIIYQTWINISNRIVLFLKK